RQYYPLFAGFHSVSKAIAVNGDKIWQDRGKIDRVDYTGLHLEDWSFSDNYHKNERLNLLSAGRNHWKKGYDYALRGCKLPKAKGSSFEYGGTGGAGNEELPSLRADLGLPEEAVFMEQVPISRVNGMRRGTSLLLPPSLEEGVATVV